MLTIVKILSSIKTFFSPTNIKLVIAGLFVVMGAIIVLEFNHIKNQNVKIARANEQNVIYARNLKVLQDSAIHWKTKDSINVVTVGLISASNDMLKTDYAKLNTKFDNLIHDNNKNVQKQTYLETQIAIKDSIIAKVTSTKPDSNAVASYIANDSTLNINQVSKYDARNYSSLSGNIKFHIDSNKIRSANIALQQKFGIGIDIATYRDANGVPHVSAGTKYPNVDINISGIQNVEDQLKAAGDKAKTKGSLGIGIMTGYGYIVGSSTTLQRGFFVGAGLVWQPNFLRFNKK